MTRKIRCHAGRGSGTGASAGATDPPPTSSPTTGQRPAAGASAAPAGGLPADDPIVDVLLSALREARHGTLFATELAAVARTAGCPTDRFERQLTAAAHAARVLVLGRPPPDVHLTGTDLRTVHLLEGPSPAAEDSARRRGEAHWAEFLRTFLTTRRCC